MLQFTRLTVVRSLSIRHQNLKDAIIDNQIRQQQHMAVRYTLVTTIEQFPPPPQKHGGASP
jgi:hypothetical protein